ncbi:MFS transporter [Nocardioides anomalus]|uniref:MFS transporter n=1 Tax=Nocardioides anomalus TaxID=2712223 RepID=A0A6G6WK63_9ACTN|nr:MFS transporter [Nocardioides anomalus]QIG45547.1 MFS transporter [Nocardioides anomalus]
MTGFRDLRRNHDFTALWVGQTVSELGSALSVFVFPLLTYALTGSTLLAATAGAMDLLGTALSVLPGGLLADRVHRRLVMRSAAAAGALLYASLVVAGVLGALTVPHVFAVALLTGVCSGVFAPAEMSAVRSVVPTEQLPTALSQQQARQHVANLLGGPVGGLLYAVTRWLPFLVDAVSFAAAWVLLGRIRTDLAPAPRAEVTRRRARAELWEGVRYSWRQPLFRTLMLYSVGSNLTINAVFMAADLRLIQAGYPAWSIGLVGTAAGVCGILGALVAPRIIAALPTGRLTVLVAWSFVPLMVPLVFFNHPVAVIIALSTGVFLNPAGNAGMSSYRMAITPPELVGRVQSVGQFLSWSLIPAAPIVGGTLLALLGGPTTMAVLAGLAALVALVPTLSRSVRAVPRPVEWQGAGGGQRLRPGPEAGPAADGADGRALEPAGAPAGHA